MALPPYFHNLDSSNYHPDAVARAASGRLQDMDYSLLLIRLGLELERDDRPAIATVLEHLNTRKVEGYSLFQMLTGSLMLALRGGEEAAIMAALEAWLAGRMRFPQNWINETLTAPELAPWLKKVGPARLVPPPISVKRRRISAKQRAFVKDIDSACRHAVADNLHWLREIGVEGEEEAIASAYRLESVDLTLHECRIGGGDLPDMIISLDERGNYVGSFLEH
jgi:hypothetical protein